MAVPENHDFQTQLESSYTTADVYAEDYRRSLLNKLIFLLDNVDPAHKNPLIKSKIRNQPYERFNHARSLVEEDAYFRYFLTTLDISELEKLLLVIKPGLELNAQTSPKTAGAYNYAYMGAPLPTTQLVVEQAYNAFGSVFRRSLELEEKLQYEQAIALDPQHILEDRELKQCGKPLDVVFKFYIPKLNNDYMQGRFNAIIRKTIRDQNLSTYDQQIRLRHTAMRLADALENIDASMDAFNLRTQVFGSEFAATCRQAYATRNAITTNKVEATAPQAISFSKLLEFFKSILPFKFSKKIVPTVPRPQLSPNYDNVDPNAARQLQELSEKILRLQQQHADLVNPPTVSKPDLMFNFKTRNKPVPFSLPELYGPHRPKLLPK